MNLESKKTLTHVMSSQYMVIGWVNLYVESGMCEL